MLRLAAALLILISPLLSCAGFHRGFDRRGLEDLARSMAGEGGGLEAGSPEELEAYLDGLDPAEKTSPRTGTLFSASPLRHWNLADRVKEDIVEERIAFEALVPFPPGHPAGTALFYHYRHTGDPGEKGRETVLFLPGLGVSDLAFRFIDRLMIDILNSGRDLLVYVPPYHLERSSGAEGEELRLFDPDLKRTLDTFFGMAAEIRSAMMYLRASAHPPACFEGWGGSMGAALLLEVSRYEKIESAALMIPVVDWNTIIAGEICGAVCLPEFEAAGFGRELIGLALGEISPAGRSLAIPAERLFIQAAHFDQLTPVERVLEFAEQQGIPNVRVYDKGHATILLDRGVYRDYRTFLEDGRGFS